MANEVGKTLEKTPKKNTKKRNHNKLKIAEKTKKLYYDIEPEKGV